MLNKLIVNGPPQIPGRNPNYGGYVEASRHVFFWRQIEEIIINNQCHESFTVYHEADHEECSTANTHESVLCDNLQDHEDDHTSSVLNIEYGQRIRIRWRRVDE